MAIDNNEPQVEGPILRAETAEEMARPWILQKVKALGELMPEACQALERSLDQGGLPGEISSYLYREFNVRLSELEVGRYGGWLPHLRREALRKAQQESDLMARAAKEKMKLKHKR